VIEWFGASVAVVTSGMDRLRIDNAIRRGTRLAEETRRLVDESRRLIDACRNTRHVTGLRGTLLQLEQLEAALKDTSCKPASLGGERRSRSV